ncbi:MAG: hypothetical protein KDK37_00990 [Leptospiraceae bacterium]|nr:hypothetical protein [Leptospiraceae bacterium]
MHPGIMRTLRKRVILALLSACMLPVLAGCELSDTEISTGNVKIIQGGNRFPLEIPPEFNYPGSNLVFSSLFEGSSYYNRPETTVSLRTDDSFLAVLNYYEGIVKKSGWSIIQSRRTENAMLLMLESGYRNLLTIIVRPVISPSAPTRRPDGEGAVTPQEPADLPGPTLVKLYLKQSGAE